MCNDFNHTPVPHCCFRGRFGDIRRSGCAGGSSDNAGLLLSLQAGKADGLNYVVSFVQPFQGNPNCVWKE